MIDMDGTSTCQLYNVLMSVLVLVLTRLGLSAENGVVCPNENELSRKEAVQDDFRIGYFESYADQIAMKIAEGVPIKSYLMWAWTDNFECKSRQGVCVKERNRR